MDIICSCMFNKGSSVKSGFDLIKQVDFFKLPSTHLKQLNILIIVNTFYKEQDTPCKSY